MDAVLLDMVYESDEKLEELRKLGDKILKCAETALPDEKFKELKAYAEQKLKEYKLKIS